MPDHGRQALYDAEDLVMRLLDRSDRYPTVEIAGSTLTLPVERHFGEIDSVQRYVDAVAGLEWVRSRWPRAAVPVAVRARQGTARAEYLRPGAVIAVPVGTGGRGWALRELVVLHEYAHHLASDEEQAAAAPHGAEFADRYLSLVQELIGPEAALLLQVSLADTGWTGRTARSRAREPADPAGLPAGWAAPSGR